MLTRTSLVLTSAAVALVAGLGLAGCKSVHTEIEIDAPPSRVWDVLARLEDYPDWNPYHVRVEGELAPGAPLVVAIEKPNGHGLVIEPHVMELDAPHRLTWGGGIRGLFHGEHVFALEPLPGGRTRLVQSEVFAGIFVPFARLAAIEEGYDLVNREVKRRVEAGTAHR